MWRRLFGPGNNVLFFNRGGFIPTIELTTHNFGETVFLNIVEILTDLYSEVEWTCGTQSAMFVAWRDWVSRNGRRILTHLFRGKGYCVVGYDIQKDYLGNTIYRFYELSEKEYRVSTSGDRVIITCKDCAQRFYILKSPTFESSSKSDHDLCSGYIKMIDAVLNGATTTAERLGAYVVMSPKSDNFGGVLLAEEKKAIEKELQREYGMLSKQKQIMTLPRPMEAQVVSLAGVDLRMNDKLRAAVLAIADRIKVPANQIALIEANASKSLSNGSEIREGDLAKYRSFRRLLNATFYDMAVELGMRVDYTIENEPLTQQGQKIEQQ